MKKSTDSSKIRLPTRHEFLVMAVVGLILPFWSCSSVLAFLTFPTSISIKSQKSQAVTILHVMSPPPPSPFSQRRTGSSSTSSSRSSAPRRNPIDEDQYVYIPKSEVDESIIEERVKQQKQLDELQQTINTQKQQIQQLQVEEQKRITQNRMNHDMTTNTLTMLWSENHSQKMKRLQGTLEFLYDEQYLLEEQFDIRNEKHQHQLIKLRSQLNDLEEKTQESSHLLGIERMYFETSIKLLEAGLDRTTNKVHKLQEQLINKTKRLGRRQGHRIDDALPMKTRSFTSTANPDKQPLQTVRIHSSQSTTEPYQSVQKQKQHYPSNFQYNTNNNNMQRTNNNNIANGRRQKRTTVTIASMNGL